MSPTPTTYAGKLAAAHKALPDDFKKSKNWTSLAEWVDAIKAMGGVDDATIRLASYEDLQEIGLPLLLAKRVASIFRGQADVPAMDEAIAGEMMHKPISNWSMSALVEALEPEKALSPAATELKRRVKDAFVVVIGNDGELDKELTLRQIGLVEEGLTPNEYIDTSNGVLQVYKVGFGPHRIKDCCPMHPEQPLIEGRCIKCQQQWNDVPLLNRQLLFYATQLKLVNPEDRPTVANLAEIARKIEGGGDHLCRTYPEARAAMDKDAKMNQLPGLKVDIGAGNQAATGGSPFGSNKEF